MNRMKYLSYQDRISSIPDGGEDPQKLWREIIRETSPQDPDLPGLLESLAMVFPDPDEIPAVLPEE